MQILIAELTQTCHACPSQWEGKTTDGKRFYARFRHGAWRIDLDGVTAGFGIESDDLDGCCSFDEICYWAHECDIDIQLLFNEIKAGES